MPPQRTSNLNLNPPDIDSCPPVNVNVIGLTGDRGPTGPCGPTGQPGPPGGCTGIGYAPLPSHTYNEFTPGIKTFQVPNKSTNAFISGMYIRMRDAKYPNWYMNGMIVSYVGTTLKVDVDSVTLGGDSETCVPPPNPCGTPGTIGYSEHNTCGTPPYAIANACAPCNGPTTVSYTSYTRNEFAILNNIIFVIEEVPIGVFSIGTEIRATDKVYPSWYINGTVIGYAGGNLNINVESIQIGAGEIVNELTSKTSFKFERGIKNFTVEKTTKITAFTKDTTVRITTPNMTCGTFMNGIVISYLEDILKVDVLEVTTATGFAPYTSFVCDWCIQALFNNDRNSGNNWRITIRDPIGLGSDSRVPFNLGNKTLKVVDGPISSFTVARGIRITDKTHPTWYMDGIVSGYSGITGTTETNLLINVDDTTTGNPSNIVYQLTSISLNSFSLGQKMFVVPFSKSISAFTEKSLVKIRALNMPIGTEMTGEVDSYIGTNLRITVKTITDCSGETTYSGNVNNWHIEAIPVNTILSGSDWFVTLRKPEGTRSDSRNKFSIGTKVFHIQEGPTSGFTHGAIIRVTDRMYPSWSMDGTVVAPYSGNGVMLSISNLNSGPETTNIINKLIGKSTHKFDLHPKTFTVEDIKSLHLFTPPNTVTVTARNMWIGMSMEGIITGYHGTQLSITVSKVDTAADFEPYLDEIDEWTIEANGCDDDISGGDWVLAPPVLGIPTEVRAIPEDKKAIISWKAPSLLTGIQNYIVISTPGGVERPTTGLATSLEFSGLTNGVTYTFRVKAKGLPSVPDGKPSSPSNPVTPTFIGRPTSVTATAGDRSARVVWTAPTSNTVVKYKVTAYDGSSNSVIDTSGTETSLNFTGLTNGTAYTFTVSALGFNNIAGPESNPSDPVTPLGIPTNVQSTAGDNLVHIEWNAPEFAQGIIKYTVTAIQDNGNNVFGSIDSAGTETFLIYPGLVNGTKYRFTVRAKVSSTIFGQDSSSSAAVMPLTIPNAVIATSGDKEVAISWTTRTSITGVLNYRVTAFDNSNNKIKSQDSSGTETSLIFKGLDNGTAYTFDVLSEGDGAVGKPSIRSNSVTPLGIPTISSVISGDEEVTVEWTEPVNRTGITGYRVTAIDDTFNRIEKASLGTAVTLLSFTGLENGTKYTFTVRALGPNPGAESNSSVVVTPLARPSKPGVIRGDTEVVVNWTTRTSDRGILSYIVTASDGSNNPIVKDTFSSGKSFTFSGLTNGTSYKFRVKAKTTGPSGDIIGPESVESETVRPVDLRINRVTATPGDQAAVISWEDKSRIPLTVNYRVTAYDSDNIQIKQQDSSGSETSLIFRELTNGTTYRFKVEAEDPQGRIIIGESSDFSNYVTPLARPTKPVVIRGDTEVVVNWTTQTSDRGILSYVVTALDGSNNPIVKDTFSIGKSFTFSGLTNGTSYKFRVKAKATGDIFGPESLESDPVRPVDLGINKVIATSRDREAAISWEDKSRAPLTIRYRVTAYDGNNSPIKQQDSSGTETSLIFKELTNGVTYRFKVEAEDTAGDTIVGESSDYSNYVTPLGIPTIVTIIPDDEKVDLDWNGPITDLIGITGYRVTAIDSSFNRLEKDSLGTAITQFSFTGLDNGTKYTFTVRALGPNLGAESNSSVVVTPLARPSKPVVIRGDTEVVVNWTTQTSDRGILSYIVTASDGSNNPIVKDTFSSGKSFTFSGLTNGIYYKFKVTAKATGPNGDIFGPQSVESEPERPLDVSINRVTAISRNREAFISWEDNSRAPLTVRYRVTAYDGNNSPIQQQDSSGSETSLIFKELTNGATYRFKVEAEDTAGDTIVGESSDYSNYVTPLGIPGKPVVESEDSKIVVDWDPPDSVVGIERYTVTAFIHNSTFKTTMDSSGTQTSLVFDGLYNGIIYRFSVKAIGPTGEVGSESVLSDYSSPLDKPIDLLVTSGDSKVIIDWEYPSGVVIAGYRISRIIDSNGILNIVTQDVYDTKPASSFTYTGLINGVTYNFRVRALVSGPGGYIEGDISDISIDVTPNTPPLAVAEGILSARVSWSGFVASPNTARYKVNLMVVLGYHDSGIMFLESSKSASDLLFTGLTNGTTYQFSIIGLDAKGNEVGTESGPSNFVITDDNGPNTP